MTDYEQVYKNAMKKARSWAKQGNAYMAQNFVNQASNVGYVSERQILYLNKAIAKAREQNQ